MKQYNYGWIAKNYDQLDGSLVPYQEISNTLSQEIKKHGNKVLDMACGTGNFTKEFENIGFEIEGCDISKEMLTEAQKKYPKIKFFKHDMRKKLPKKYDIILCMFNSIGHLTTPELKQTLKNFSTNTKIIVFDIFNFDFMNKNFIYNEFIDISKTQENTKLVRFNHNKLDKKNKIMKIQQKTYIQKDFTIQKYNFNWELKIYTKTELESILTKTGYKILSIKGNFTNKEFQKFDKYKSMSITIIAQSIKF